MSSASSSVHDNTLALVRRMIPPLSPKLHKGQAGRIGVLGGSADYTGAPFFSAMGAMRFGADLAHVICEPQAATVIKSYAPDLIVHGVLDAALPEAAIKELESVLERLHVLVIGPGLGRSAFMQGVAAHALRYAKGKEGLGVVVDADGLWLVNSKPELVKGWTGDTRVVLTPNVMEFQRLVAALNLSDSDRTAASVARALGNVVILEKGPQDHIASCTPLPAALNATLGVPPGTDTLVDASPGGLKRVGGQGDILSGTVGALLAWGREWGRGAYAHVGAAPDEELRPYVALLAAYGASAFTRALSRKGFEVKGRSMVTHDLVELVGTVYEDVLGEKGEGEVGSGAKGRL